MDTRGLACRGIRGATTVGGAGLEALGAATIELLDELVSANGCELEALAAVIFTLSADLRGANPAEAARSHGWGSVPFVISAEGGPDQGIERVLRVLLLWNTTKSQSEIRHIYLRGAASLRPDLAAPATSHEEKP